MERPKKCFGRLDEVFPPVDGGLRESPARCCGCAFKTECLRAALRSEEGIAFRQRRIEKMESPGFLGRVRRWSRLKALAAERRIIRKDG